MRTYQVIENGNYFLIILHINADSEKEAREIAREKGYNEITIVELNTETKGECSMIQIDKPYNSEHEYYESLYWHHTYS